MKNKQFLTFNSEIKGIDEKENTLTAYVSTAARDRGDEVLEPGGADLKQFKANPVVLFAHNYHEPPIGKALWIKKDANGIIAKVKFATTEFAQEIFTLFKEGFMKAFSVGFIPKEWEDGDGKKSPRRTYKKWELLEFSAVPVPANPEALMLAMEKGLHISDTLKKELLQDAIIPDEEVIEKEPIKQEPPKNYMDDIIALEAEIEQLKQREQDNLSTIANLEREVKELMYKLYTSNVKPEAVKAEVTGNDIALMIRDVVTSEIDKVKGRVS